MNNDPRNTWQDFILELQQSILPIYQVHELSFDRVGIHGRMHICRAVIFGEVMARIYHAAGIPVDFYGVRTAIAFHDSGREGNGKDLWEKESTEKCFNYLKAQPAYSKNLSAAHEIADWILKEGDFSPSHTIVFSADVLEIMRPCCGHGGRDGFNRYHLRFAGQRDTWAGPIVDRKNLRDNLIQEAWEFIDRTENIKSQFSASDRYMEELVDYISDRKDRFKLLSLIL